MSYDITGLVTHWMPLPETPKERYKCRYADGNGVCSKLSGNGEIIYCVEGRARMICLRRRKTNGKGVY